MGGGEGAEKSNRADPHLPPAPSATNTAHSPLPFHLPPPPSPHPTCIYTPPPLPHHFTPSPPPSPKVLPTLPNSPPPFLTSPQPQMLQVLHHLVPHKPRPVDRGIYPLRHTPPHTRFAQAIAQSPLHLPQCWGRLSGGYFCGEIVALASGGQAGALREADGAGLAAVGLDGLAGGGGLGVAVRVVIRMAVGVAMRVPVGVAVRVGVRVASSARACIM